jgi:hypothetical protein
MGVIFVDRRRPGEEADLSELYVIPSVYPYVVRLNEVPLRYINTITTGSITLREQSGGLPLPGCFIVDYDRGSLTFNVAQAGYGITVAYKGTGSVIWAEDLQALDSTAFNDIQSEIEDARGTCVDLDTRLSVFFDDSGVPKSIWGSGSMEGAPITVQEDGSDVAIYPTKINFSHGLDISVDINPSGTAVVAIDESEIDISLLPFTPTGSIVATSVGGALNHLATRVIPPAYTLQEILNLPADQKALGEQFYVIDAGRTGTWNGEGVTL